MKKILGFLATATWVVVGGVVAICVAYLGMNILGIASPLFYWHLFP